MPLIETAQRHALSARAVQSMRVLAQPKTSAQSVAGHRIACVARIAQRRALILFPMVHPQ